MESHWFSKISPFTVVCGWLVQGWRKQYEIGGAEGLAHPLQVAHSAQSWAPQYNFWGGYSPPSPPCSATLGLVVPQEWVRDKLVLWQWLHLRANISHVVATNPVRRNPEALMNTPTMTMRLSGKRHTVRIGSTKRSAIPRYACASARYTPIVPMSHCRGLFRRKRPKMFANPKTSR